MGGGTARTQAGTGGSFGGPNSPGAGRGAPGGLEDLMGQVLGGRKPAGGGATPGAGGAGPTGGLGDLLEQLAGGSARVARGRPPGARAARRAAAGWTTCWGNWPERAGWAASSAALRARRSGHGRDARGQGRGPAGGAPATKTAGQPSFGELLNQSLQNYGEPETPPAPAQEAAAR